MANALRRVMALRGVMALSSGLVVMAFLFIVESACRS
jgi:hypothetical protein